MQGWMDSFDWLIDGFNGMSTHSGYAETNYVKNYGKNASII